jgi:hypothetical protein
VCVCSPAFELAKPAPLRYTLSNSWLLAGIHERVCLSTKKCVLLLEYVLLQDGEVKMIDFGFSKMFHGTKETH